MTETWPTVVPMPTYEDVAATADWLCAAFGFAERERFGEDDGRITTAILSMDGGGVVMLGWAGPDYRAPRRHAEECEAAQRWSALPWAIDAVLVTVDDVDAHAERARAAGARLLSEPEDSPHGRLYRAEDPEGHRWMFVAPGSS